MAYRTKEDILSIVTTQLDNAEAFMEVLTPDRDEAVQYYTGRRPYPQPCRSKHVSLDVLDTVESIRSLMLEMLTSGDGVVDWRDRVQPGSMREALAREYVNEQFIENNRGVSLLSDFLFDAAMYKLGVFQIEWEKAEQHFTRDFEDLTDEELVVLSQDGRFDGFEAVDRYIKDGVYVWRGSFYLTRPCGKVKIRCVRPDHFYMPEMPQDVIEPDFVCERTGPMEGDLYAEGISTKIVEALPVYYNDDYRTSSAFEEVSGEDYEAVPSGRTRRDVYVAYIRADFERKNDMQLYEVRFNRGLLIDYKPVDTHNYFWWSPFRVSHKAVGLSYADVNKGVQAHKTAIRRGVVDNVVATTNLTRYVNKNMFVDPQRLQNERWREVHDVYDIDKAVREAQIPQLSQSTMPMLETLDQEKQNRSGMSLAAAGMNPDVLSHQNSHALVNEYTRAGMRRPAQQVRVLIDVCLGPMMKHILYLGAQFDTDSRVYEIDSQTITMNPSELDPDTLGMSPRLALTASEQEQEAATLLRMDASFKDPNTGMGPLYSEANRYRLMQRAMKLLGLSAYNGYLTNPESTEYQQQQQQAAEQQQQAQQLADEAQKAQIAAQQTLAQAEMMKAEAANMKAETERMIDLMRVELERLELENKMENEDDKIDIERAKVRNDNIKAIGDANAKSRAATSST